MDATEYNQKLLTSDVYKNPQGGLNKTVSQDISASSQKVKYENEIIVEGTTELDNLRSDYSRASRGSIIRQSIVD